MMNWDVFCSDVYVVEFVLLPIMNGQLFFFLEPLFDAFIYQNPLLQILQL